MQGARRRRVVPVGITITLLLSACSGPRSNNNNTTNAASTSPRSAIAQKRIVGLNKAVGFGLLRVMQLGERPDPLHVVIYAARPNELPRVAGVITTVMQTPLSHVNLRAVQDRVPNAVVTDALKTTAITRLVGRYVRYEVTDTGYSLGSATQAEVEANHKNRRPSTAQFPKRDLTIKAITPLDAVSFDQWTTFGVKSANVATLRTLDLGDVVVPNGFAVPFWFYDEFMRSNGLYRVAEAMMAVVLADQVLRHEAQCGPLKK